MDLKIEPIIRMSTDMIQSLMSKAAAKKGLLCFQKIKAVIGDDINKDGWMDRLQQGLSNA